MTQGCLMNKSVNIIDTVFKKSDELVHRKIAEETILVPIRGTLADMQKIFALNPVAEFVWDLLDGRNSVGEMVEKVVSEFEVERKQAEADLDEFVIDLLNAGLIVEAE